MAAPDPQHAEHPNVALGRRLYEAFEGRDIEAMTELIADDARWHISGTSEIAGDISGRDRIFKYFGRIAEATNGTYRAEVHDIVGGPDHVAVVVHATGERNGKRLDHWRVDLFHPSADGKINEYWAVWIDQAAVDEFWG